MAWIVKSRRLNKESGKRETYFALAWRDDTAKVRTRALGFTSPEEARAALKVMDARLALGQGAEPTNSAGGSSVASSWSGPTLKRYLEDTFLPVVERDKAPKTYESALRASCALVPLLGHLPVRQVSYAEVDAYVTKRKGAGRRSRTIILELWLLRGALAHACDSGIIAEVPKLPRIQDRDRQPHRYLTPEQTVALLSALRPPEEQPEVTRGRPPQRFDELSFLAILMAVNTGMRRGEILSRGWEDVRWDVGPHGVLVVCAKSEVRFRVKTGRERAIPLNRELQAELLSAHEKAGHPKSGWIFPNPHDPSRPRRNFRSALKAACERAGLPQIHPHGLRHTWASRLAMAGVDRKTCMELGGWADGEMLDQVYAHVTTAHMAEAMARTGLSDRPIPEGEGAGGGNPSARRKS